MCTCFSIQCGYGRTCEAKAGQEPLRTKCSNVLLLLNVPGKQDVCIRAWPVLLKGSIIEKSWVVMENNLAMRTTSKCESLMVQKLEWSTKVVFISSFYVFHSFIWCQLSHLVSTRGHIMFIYKQIVLWCLHFVRWRWKCNSICTDQFSSWAFWCGVDLHEMNALLWCLCFGDGFTVWHRWFILLF